MKVDRNWNYSYNICIKNIVRYNSRILKHFSKILTGNWNFTEVLHLNKCTELICLLLLLHHWMAHKHLHMAADWEGLLFCPNVAHILWDTCVHQSTISICQWFDSVTHNFFWWSIHCFRHYLILLPQVLNGLSAVKYTEWTLGQVKQTVLQ